MFNKNENKMTVMELMKVMGETIDELHDTELGSEEFGGVLRRAESEARVAKQFIRGADLIYKSDKMKGQSARIDAVIGK